MEDPKVKKAFSQINSLKLVKIFHRYQISSKNLNTKYNYNKLFLEKDFKYKHFPKNISLNHQTKIINFDKTFKNIINEKNSKKCENSKTLSTKKEINDNEHKTDVLKCGKKNKEKNKKDDLYGQSFNLSRMREKPPTKPELFSHLYIFNNKKTLYKENENFFTKQKGRIPNVFYNHFLINNNLYNFNNKYNYTKIAMTQRNKNKLITIIYYTP